MFPMMHLYHLMESSEERMLLPESLRRLGKAQRCSRVGQFVNVSTFRDGVRLPRHKPGML